MAVLTSAKQSIAAQGVGAVISEFNKFESTTEPKRSLGYKVEDVQGNVYRWAHFGAATNRGVIVATDVSESGYVDTDNVVVAPASCVNSGDNKAGAYFVEITLAAITASQFAGGKLLITDDTGEGYTYDIINNTATADPVAGNFRIQLAQPLQADLAADSDFAIAGNPYANVEPVNMSGASGDLQIVGVSCATQAANDFGWVQTRGVCGVLTEGTLLLGNGVVPSLTTTGAIAPAVSTTTGRIIGTVVDIGDSTGHSLVDLKI